MPAIFSKEKLEKVWDLVQKDTPRSEVAKKLAIDLDAIDAYILASFKKFTVPVMRYKLDNQLPLFATSTSVPKKKVKRTPSYITRSREAEPRIERPKAQYSNPQFHQLY